MPMAWETRVFGPLTGRVRKLVIDNSSTFCLRLYERGAARVACKSTVPSILDRRR
jgi:hypothetical protein